MDSGYFLTEVNDMNVYDTCMPNNTVSSVISSVGRRELYTHHHLQDLPHSITVDRVIRCCFHLNPVIAQLQGNNHMRHWPGGHGLDLHFSLVGALFAGRAANMFCLHEIQPCLIERPTGSLIANLKKNHILENWRTGSTAKVLTVLANNHKPVNLDSVWLKQL